MTDCDPGSPGSHPHSDRPNWQPATTIDDYLRNCREGLEEKSDRRAAKLMGVSRMWVYRAKLMSELPRDLFERLLAMDKVPSTKQFASIALALRRGEKTNYAERCPHCGELLRVRQDFGAGITAVVNEWLAERR